MVNFWAQSALVNLWLENYKKNATGDVGVQKKVSLFFKHLNSRVAEKFLFTGGLNRYRSPGFGEL